MEYADEFWDLYISCWAQNQWDGQYEIFFQDPSKSFPVWCRDEYSLLNVTIQFFEAD